MSASIVCRANPRIRATGLRSAVVAIVAVVFALATPGCSSSPARDADAFCTAYVDVARRATSLTNPDEVPLPTLRSQVGAVEAAASDAVEVAPEDIADTVDAVVEPLRTLRRSLEEADSRTAVNRAFAAFGSDAAKLAATQKRLDAWTAANCGVVPVTSTTTPVTIEPGITG